MTLPAPRPLELPTMMFVTTCQTDEGFVAHALDFDLVSVAASEPEAMEKVRLAVKTYIEYGVNNRCEADVVYHAPQEFWDKITEGTPIRLLEPITVMDRRLLVVATAHTHDARPASSVA